MIYNIYADNLLVIKIIRKEMVMDDLENIDMYCSVTNCPIKEFIKELTAKHQYQEVAQIIHHIKLLNNYGYELKKHKSLL